MNEEQTLYGAVKSACAQLREVRPDQIIVEWKGPHNPVTNWDKKIEQLLRSELCNSHMNINGEEFPYTDKGADRTAYIDPIDGTKSFIKGEFGCSVSVGVYDRNKPAIGIVGDFRANKLYYADNNQSFIEDLVTGIKAPLAVQYVRRDLRDVTPHSLELSVATNDYEGGIIKAIHDAGFDVRRPVAIALQLAHVAAGVTDAMVYRPRNTKPHDVAAGLVLLESVKQDANIVATTYYGEPLTINELTRGMIIAPKEAHKRLMEVLPR
jgi:myo-inositol-1(or 4)-monophosphatase